jgi:hypothetical protein
MRGIESAKVVQSALQDAAPYRLLLTDEEAVTSQLAESRAELITAAART